MKRLVILLAAFLALAYLAHSQIVPSKTPQPPTQPPYIGITVLQNPPVAYPGTVVQLTVVLTSTAVVGPLDVYITSPSLSVLTGGSYHLAGLAPGTPVTLTAVVKVPFGTAPGNYGVTVGLVNPINNFQFESSTYYVQVSPLSYDALVVPIVRGLLAPGQVVEIPILFINPTVDVVKASARLVGGPFTQFSNASLTCSAYVPPESNSTCVIPAVVERGLQPGSYTAVLNVTYLDTANNATVSFSKNFTVAVVQPVSFNVGLIPQGSIVPGLPTTLLVSISAGGLAQPTNVTVTPLNTSDISFISRPIKLPLLTSIQIPVEAIINRYGTITASFEICYYTNICTVENASLYVPAPNLAINVVQNPPWAYPGSIVQLTVTLATNQPVGPLTVYINSDKLEVLEGGVYNLPGMAPGSPVTLTALVEVPKDAAPGLYPLTVSAGGYTYEYHVDVQRPNFGIAIAANPPTAYPGAVVALNIVITSDAQMRGVSVNISTPLAVLEGASYYLPVLPSGNPVTLTSVLKVPGNATPGDYPVYVSVDGSVYVSYVHVEPATVIIQGVAMEPPVVIAGGLVPYIKAVVSVVNTGLVPARGASISISGVPVVGNSTVNVGVLPPGQPIQIPFLINASALGPGQWTAKVSVSWIGGEASSAAPLTVLPKAELKVYYNVSNAQPGSTAVVTITVVNKGPVPAKMVALQWTPNQVFQIHTPSSATPTANLLESSMRFLGDIYPGQSVTTTYLIDVSSNVPDGVYYATLVLEWNETGALAPVVETIQIPISVRSSINLLEVGPLAAALLIVIVGAAVYLRRRRSGRTPPSPA
ncbi:MAG: hypothetical protein ACP5I3_01820 [Thermoproteus sp.]